MEQALNNFECWTDTNGDRIKFRDKSECRQNLQTKFNYMHERIFMFMLCVDLWF